MYCYCKDEFDWLMKMLERGNCFFDWDKVADFIDDDLIELRYMKKRFGYLFYNHFKYIKKVNGRNAIFVNKDDGYVCRKPDEEHYHGVEETENGKNYLDVSIPMEDRSRYDIKYLDEIDKGVPFYTKDEEEQDDEVLGTDNILKQIKLIKPEIYNSDKFYEVLYSTEFDNIELEKDRDKFYEQVKKYILV